MKHNRDGRAIHWVSALFGITLLTTVLPILLAQQTEQKKKPARAPNDLCPDTLLMQFGDFYYYDCFKRNECDGTKTHTLAGNVRPHTLGCTPKNEPEEDVCDNIPGPSRHVTKQPDKKKRKKVKSKPGPIPPGAEPGDPDVRATIFKFHPNLKVEEQFATYLGDDTALKGRKFRVVKVTWPIGSGSTQETNMCHECEPPGPTPMTLVGPNNGEVKVEKDVGSFGKDELVEIVVFE